MLTYLVNDRLNAKKTPFRLYVYETTVHYFYVLMRIKKCFIANTPNSIKIFLWLSWKLAPRKINVVPPNQEPKRSDRTPKQRFEVASRSPFNRPWNRQCFSFILLENWKLKKYSPEANTKHAAKQCLS